MTDKFDILGVKVDATNLSLASQNIAEWIRHRRKVYICVAPVSTVVECQSNPEYREVINGADMVTPDGMPLVWLGKLKGNKVIQRTYGPDLMLKVCSDGEMPGFRHYFYGSTVQVCEQLESRLKRKFPEIKIVGKFSPPFTDNRKNEDTKIIDEINRAKPDILWVGLGSPKQDFWMHKHRDKLEVPVIIGVGAAFDFLAGAKKQAPRWMQRSGLEWLFRLFCEPRRLWKRYLIGNTKFIYYLLADLIRQKFTKPA